jgi:nucleoside-triphosphatase THEP1
MGLFSDVMVQVLSTNVSDHKPLLIAMMKETEDRRVRSSGFKFEASWLLDKEYNRVVQEVWIETEGGITAIGTVQEKLAPCQTKLKNWSSRKFGQAEKVLKEKTKALEVLQRNEGLENVEEIKCLQGEIDYILDQEDVKWKQRGKQNWFKEGDRNTSFFNA